MNRFKVYGLTCLFLFVAAFANATTIVMPEDESLIGKSPVIVEGSVLSSAAVEIDGRIYTETVLSVSRALKGEVDETITIRELGGEVNGRFTKIFGTPQFKSGERVLVFLEPNPRGGYRTMDLFIGKFAEGLTRSGQRLWLRNDEMANVTLLNADFQPIANRNVQRDAAKFEKFIADRVSGGMGIRNYGVENPVLAPAAGGGRRVEANFELISEPNIYRWAMFDNGTTANWVSGGTQTGYTGGGVNELRTAMASWTDYTEANILYAYTGTRSGSFGGLSFRNNVNEVLFDDPLSEISGTFNRSTGGVVGTGGFNGVTSGGNWTAPFTADPAHPQGTLRAFSIVEGNLTIQDGVTPTAGVSSNRLAEIVAHEFGHTLGFGHSADATALMYATVTGLGPSLRTDDKLAARWLYPNGNVDPGPAPTVPAAPSSLAATVTSATTVDLSWRDNSDNETGFSVFVAGATGAFTKVGDVGSNTTRATLTGMSAATTYRVYVQSFNTAGTAQSNTVTVTTTATGGVTANFSFTPTTGISNVTTFTFTDESVNATSRTWNFGDGTSSAQAVATKVYAAPGTYNVTLIATGAGGATATVSKTVVVTGPLTAAFRFSPANPTTDDTIQFTDETTGGVTSWRWVFGDGQTSNEQNPTKRYFTASSFSVTLTVFRNTESSTVTKTITVRNPAPVTPNVVAAFDYSPSTPVVGQSITLTDQSTGSPTSWSWSFGDGRTSTQRNPQLTYGVPGTYQVTLTAANSGSSATVTRNITVVGTAPHRSLVSVTAQTDGVGGTSWRTELSLFNAGNEGANVTLLFLPGAGGSVVSRNVFLAPKQLVTYANTLLDLFGMANGAGAVAIEATGAATTPELRVASRTFTGGARGTYGQAVPAVGKLYPVQWVTGIQSNPNYRTNIGIVNRSNAERRAIFMLMGPAGEVIRTESLNVAANTFMQLPLVTLFPSIDGTAFDALTLLVNVQQAEAISVYASVIDNDSQDPVYIQATPGMISGSMILPVVGRAPGANNTYWRSDVTLHNPIPDPMTITLRYGGATRNVTLAASSTTVMRDVLSTFNQTAGQGPLQITWTAGRVGPIVTSRTYTTTEDGGTYGQSIDPVETFSHEVFVPGLRNDASYRSNVGFVNGGTTSETFTVSVLSPSGTKLGETSLTLGPGESTQAAIASLFPSLSSAGSFTLAVRGDDNAQLFAYGSMVDNDSGDPVFFAGN